MILEHRGKRPVIPDSAYVAPSATLCGAVTLGERARVLHGAVLTAEDGEIQLGTDVVVMEHALIRGRARHPAHLGDAFGRPHRGAAHCRRGAAPPATMRWSASAARSTSSSVL